MGKKPKETTRPNGIIEYRLNGSKAWYVNGECHREDGPAVIWNNGSMACYINGEYNTEEDYIEYLLSYYSKKISPGDLISLESL